MYEQVDIINIVVLRNIMKFYSFNKNIICF